MMVITTVDNLLITFFNFFSEKKSEVSTQKMVNESEEDDYGKEADIWCAIPR